MLAAIFGGEGAQWEISCRYAMFATPVAYFIDEAGVIVMDVAVGGDAIGELLAQSLTDWEPTRT